MQLGPGTLLLGKDLAASITSASVDNSASVTPFSVIRSCSGSRGRVGNRTLTIGSSLLGTLMPGMGLLLLSFLMTIL